MTFSPSNWVHLGVELCARGMPASHYKDLYDSLICGQPVSAPYRGLFIDTGLIHIMVVSGAHLHFIEFWFQWLPRQSRILLLGLYCWLTDFGPPVVRAWVRRILTGPLRQFRVSTLQLELMVIIVTLALVPGWISSRSLLMCWTCALALALPHVLPRWPTLSLSLTCYVLLFPFCPSTPGTILCNVLVAPLIGGVLFPLCLLAAVIPKLVPLVDGVWLTLLEILRQMPMAAPAPLYISSKWLVLYPLTLHAGLLAAEVPWRRARSFS